MKNMKKIISIIIILICAFALMTCDNFEMGTIFNTIAGRGQVYVQRGNNNSRSTMSARNVYDEYEIEFLLYVLMLKDDTKEGGIWVIGSETQGNGLDNQGWYDIDGVNRKNFIGNPHNRPHSCFLLRIAGIRINNTFFAAGNDEFGEWGMVPFDGNKDDYIIDMHGSGAPNINFIAGDLSKFGPGEGFGDADTKNIPFVGIPSGVWSLQEFIVYSDESKLFEDDDGTITLKEDWWESFSFIVR